jgi:glycosyltransferase involved in cell wall biosynthesis
MFGYQSKIISYQIDESYPHTKGEVDGIEMEFLENKGKNFFWEKAVVDYLKKNAPKIDVLNLYHFEKDSFIYGNVYKKYHPKGILYLKMDAYNEAFKNGKKHHTKKWYKQFFFKKLEADFIKNVDLISIENTTGYEWVKKAYPELSGKLFYLPNGINDWFLTKHFPKIKTFDEKENIILTVGRIGLEVKNNEMLLETIPQLNLDHWKVYFVGPIADRFRPKIDAFYKMHPQLKEKVIFTGEINDRTELYEFYNRSKIFCLTSPFESFGMAFIEAMYFGNYLLGTTGMSAFKDITDNFEFGDWVEVNKVSLLAEKMNFLIKNEAILRDKQPKIAEFCKKHFSWSSLITNLENQIKNIE